MLLLGVAAACGRKNQNIFVDVRGTAHFLATDKKRNTLTNPSGYIIALQTEDGGRVVTGAGGAAATELLEYPCFVHEKPFGKVVLEVSNFTVEVPKGWNVIPDARSGLMDKTDGNGLQSMRALFTPHSEGYEKLKAVYVARAAEFNEMVRQNNPEATARTFAKQLFGKEAFFLEYKIPGASGAGGGTVQCSVLVQPGAITAEVLLDCDMADYNDAAPLMDLAQRVEPK
jgi:hypothetical protein